MSHDHLLKEKTASGNLDIMDASDLIKSRLVGICDGWAENLRGLEDTGARIDYVKSVMPRLLRDRSLWVELLGAAAKGGGYPDLRQATMFNDELILYANNQRLFSLRLFVYAPGEYTPIHDHNAWGVIGSVAGPVEIVRYQREDDGSREGYAQLRLEGRSRLAPGEIDVTCPLDAGIHQTGSPGPGTGVMLSVYGNPLRRLYIHRFDQNSRRVFRMYPPRLHKKRMAGRALEDLLKTAP